MIILNIYYEYWKWLYLMNTENDNFKYILWILKMIIFNEYWK